MAFIEKSELKSRTHNEIIDAITRNDDTIIDMIIDENISYMKSFLRARYDVDSVFAETGSNRNQVIVKVLKDLVVFDIYSSHNPVQITEVLRDSRSRAEAWLKAVQREEINPDLPAATSEGSTYIQYGSNTKRGNIY